MKTTFKDYLKACSYFYEHMNQDTYMKTNLVINDISFNVHLYRLKENVVLSNNQEVKNIFNLCNQDDDATQIILCKSLTINNDITLTPPYRCKGLIIFANYEIVNNGTISMTSRGCIAEGQNIYLYQNEFVPAIGGAGAVRSLTRSLSNDGGNCLNGNPGTNGTGRQTGGGGSGSVRNYVARMYPGSGGAGTSYSGGCGGGAAATDRASSRTAGDGSSIGGAGGHGAQGGAATGNSGGDTNGWGQAAGGGQGNGPGNNVWSHAVASVPSQPVGTGGLLIIYCKIFNNINNIYSKGIEARYTSISRWNGSQGGGHNLSGGSSGGGSINIFYNTLLSQGLINADGGASQTTGMTWYGGAGGNGTITLTQISDEYFPNINISELRRNSDIYKDPYPESAFDFELLFNEDDLIITED